MRLTATVFAITMLSACAQELQEGEIRKVIYTDNFPGLIELGNRYSEAKFDYELDAKDGSLMRFKTCSDIQSTDAGSIKEDQFSLLTMLKLNCIALNRYFTAKDSQKTYFPKNFSSKAIQLLPASATPDLGGDLSPARNKKISQVFPNLDASEISPTVVRTNLGGLEIDYTLLARGDLDGNGTEDMIVRMDWSNTSAFGNGYELVILGGEDHHIQLLERIAD